jgi:hypothetical protein
VHLCTIFAVTLTFDAVRGAFRDNATLFVVMIASFGMAAGTHWEVFEWIAGLGHELAAQRTFPLTVKNDRVRRQAGCQAVPVRSMALSVTTSLRMQAVNASLAGFPARRSRR